jgi:hypothetical protein
VERARALPAQRLRWGAVKGAWVGFRRPCQNEKFARCARLGEIARTCDSFPELLATKRSAVGNYEKYDRKMRRIIGGRRASSQLRLRPLARGAIIWQIMSWDQCLFQLSKPNDGTGSNSFYRFIFINWQSSINACVTLLFRFL